MIQTILEVFQQFWSSIISFLPGSPFRAFISSINEIPYMAEFNWFFPLGEVFAVLQAWLVTIGVYYLYSAIMRFIRLL